MSFPASKIFPHSQKTPPTFEAVTALLDSGVDSGVFPGAVLLVAVNGEVNYYGAVGNKFDTSVVPRDPVAMSVDTVFDVGTITNIAATTVTLMRHFEQKKFRLEDRVSMYLQAFSVHNKSPITVAHLLSHTAGLPGHWPFYEELLRENAGARMGILTSRGARDYVITLINRSGLRYPVGSRQVYSDVGFILLGHLIEILSGIGLDKALFRYVTQPLGLKSTSFIDIFLNKRHGIMPITDVIAPTEYCPWRKRVMWGEAWDDNAWAMGGIAGHSGLFSSAHDMHILARELLSAFRGGSKFLSRETMQIFSARQTINEGDSWRLGFDSPSRENGMLECGFSDKALGVNGSTGCSLWFDPLSGVDVVLMSNWVHPTRHNRKMHAFRTDLHRAVMEALSKH